MNKYWCIACGYHGDFKKDKKRGLNCESCGYDDLLELTETEYKKAPKLSKRTLEQFKKDNKDLLP